MSRALLPKHVAAVIKHQKDPLKALKMFNSVEKEDGFKHTLLTYKCMVEKLGLHGEFEAMERVLMEVRMNIDNSLLEGMYIGAMKHYGRKGKLQEAVDVFERMDFYNCEPSGLSYNAIMNILVENGYYNQAHKVYLRMKDKGIVPDIYTFTIRMKSFCKTKRPHAALRLLNNIPCQECDLNAVAYCTVISGFFEENYPLEAHDLFNKMTSSVIRGFCSNSNLDGAYQLFRRMEEEYKISHTIATYNIMINAFSEKLDMCMAGKLFQEMGDKGCSPDSYTYRVMIDGFCKVGNIDSAHNLLLTKIEKGFIPSLMTFGHVINCLCVQHRVDEAVDIIHLMVHKGIVPEVVNTIFEADKKAVAAPKITVEELLRKSHITYYAYELLFDGIRDSKSKRKKLPARFT